MIGCEKRQLILLDNFVRRINELLEQLKNDPNFNLFQHSHSSVVIALETIGFVEALNRARKHE